MKQVWIKALLWLLVSNSIATFSMDQHLANLLNNQNGRYLKSIFPEAARSALDLIAALTTNSALQRAFLKTPFFKNKNFDLLIHQVYGLTNEVVEENVVEPAIPSSSSSKPITSLIKNPLENISEPLNKLSKDPSLDDIEITSLEPVDASTASSSKSQGVEVLPKACLFCLEEKYTKDLVTFNCGHALCCKECLNDYLNYALQQKNISDLKCPECKIPLEEVDIREITIDKNMWTAFADIATQRALEIDQNIKQCPTPDCPNKFIPADQRAKITCEACKISYCSHCLIDHESAISCKQAEADRIKDPLNEEWKKNNNVKHCPQCGVWVEKISGCDYLECKKCRYSFCWQCLGPHDHNMGAHKHIS